VSKLLTKVSFQLEKLFLYADDVMLHSRLFRISAFFSFHTHQSVVDCVPMHFVMRASVCKQ
jgi:hypothetical protein